MVIDWGLVNKFSGLSGAPNTSVTSFSDVSGENPAAARPDFPKFLNFP